MPLNLSDEALAELRKAAPDALIEIACRLYTADLISKPAAGRLAALSRNDFEGELTKRGLPWIRITGDDYLEQEMGTLEPSAGRTGETRR